MIGNFSSAACESETRLGVLRRDSLIRIAACRAGLEVGWKAVMRRIELPNPAHLVLMVAVLCLAQPRLLAQTQSGSDAPTNDTGKSWTATTEQQNTTATSNPTRMKETHAETKGRTVDKQAVERLGPDGRYEPYLDTEKESVRVDATTVRTTERSFGRSPDGQKTLMQVTEEETRTLPGGEQKVVRTTSNPDVNGRLQVVRREIQNAKQISSAARETKTTVFSPDVNGGLVPAKQVEERENRSNDHTIEFRKSTLLPDTNGNWQLNEVREGVIKEEKSKDRIKEERVLRPDIEGKLALSEQTISKESASAPGENRKTVETYSTDLPGTSPDGSLRLNQRVTTVLRKGTDGGQVTEERVEQRNPAAPGDNLRVTQKTIDIARPGTGGTTNEQRTIQSLDSNGNLGVVWVDTGKADHTPAVQVDTKPPAKPQ